MKLFIAGLLLASSVMAFTQDEPLDENDRAFMGLVAQLGDKDPTIRDNAKNQLKELPDKYIPQMLVIASGLDIKIADNKTLKNDLVGIAKHIFTNKTVQRNKRYKLLTMNVGLSISDKSEITTVANYNGHLVCVYGLQITKIDDDSAFKTILKEGDIIVGVVNGDTHILTYKPLSTYEASLSLLDYLIDEPEASMVIIRKNANNILSAMSVKVTLEKKVTISEDNKKAMNDLVEELWKHIYYLYSNQ